MTGKLHATWRLNDDKDLHVHDQVMLVDKVDPNIPSSWKSIGVAQIKTILEKPLGDITQADMTDGRKFVSTDELIKVFRDYYGPHVDEQVPVKIIQFTFSPVNDVTKESGATPTLKHAKLFADGGSRGNPGPSAAGFVLLDDTDKVLVENGLYLGVTTNNQAEYHALKIGLEEAKKQGINSLDVYMDSMLVVNQMKGSFKVKNQDLVAINKNLKELAGQFAQVTFTHIPRELNKVADSMVNEILDASGAPKKSVRFDNR